MTTDTDRLILISSYTADRNYSSSTEFPHTLRHERTHTHGNMCRTSCI